MKIGRHGSPKMLILIPILVFWICKPKFVFGQVWIEKIRVIYFAWKLVPRYRHWYRQCWFWFQHWSYEFSILDLFLGELRQKCQSWPFCLKIGTHDISRMLILIRTLVFWISNPKSLFTQIWAKKVKVVRFPWTLAHMVSRGWWFLFCH